MIIMPKHRAGEKMTPSHTTVTDGGAVVADGARKCAEVTKVILGRIKSQKSGMRRLKFKEINAGWVIDVVGNSSIQQIYVYTTDREVTKKALRKVWPG